MLSDPTQSEEFRQSKHWDSPLLDFQLRVEGSGLSGPAFRSNSFSGNERNRLLLAGEQGFTDRSLVSGVDSKKDARSFAILDFDGDGWLDIALASANAPRLQLFRNQIAKTGATGHAVAIRLIGAVENGSNRDAVGALVSANGRLFRRSLGEGLAAQNSSAIWISEGTEIKVQWPSGQKTTHVIPPDQRQVTIAEPLMN